MSATAVARNTVGARQLLLLLLLCVVATTTVHAFPVGIPSFQQQQRQQHRPTITLAAESSSDDTTATARPFAVVVQADIDPDRMHEFLSLIQTNAVETRKEPGCLRFDVLRSQDNPAQFFFYELYKNEAAIDHHKQQPHYNLWATFKESGGVIQSTTYKTDAEFLT